MITSTANQRVKDLIRLRKKSKERAARGVFLAEGTRMISETPADLIEECYFSESFYEKIMQRGSQKSENLCASDGTVEKTDLGGERLVHKIKEICQESTGCFHEVLSDSVFAAVSDTETPQGVLAVVKMPHYEKKDLFQKGNGLFLVLETIQDPGNLGTIFRTAEGAGVDGIILNHTCVDLFQPKVVRSTMGSIYRVPFMITKDLPQTIGEMKGQGIFCYAAHLDGSVYYAGNDYKNATAFFIGNEGNGLSDEIASMADSYIRIPMEGRLESLNAAMAAGILMYEAKRQRDM